ncbi:MAG: nuclear transport factor 2 family protein [Acidobacteria bacterium]|nr:nuclear transport factor 2 family protein [Acidobacteriota bacterium]
MAMTLKELENEVKALKKQVAENARAKDCLEIWKLQSLYSHLYHIGRNSEVPSLFAQKTPGVVMEIEDSGVYEGLESVTYFWNEVFNVDRMQRTPGFLAIHMTVNPVIEINRKGTRAKGLWHSHGVCSFEAGGVMKQFNCLGKYDIEYVKEDGQWKFLKFAYRLTYMCPYEKGWMEEPVAASIAGNPLNRPDKPTTWHMPYSRYRINVFQPPPPEPYKD